MQSWGCFSASLCWWSCPQWKTTDGRWRYQQLQTTLPPASGMQRFISQSVNAQCYVERDPSRILQRGFKWNKNKKNKKPHTSAPSALKNNCISFLWNWLTKVCLILGLGYLNSWEMTEWTHPDMVYAFFVICPSCHMGAETVQRHAEPIITLHALVFFLGKITSWKQVIHQWKALFRP